MIYFSFRRNSLQAQFLWSVSRLSFKVLFDWVLFYSILLFSSRRRSSILPWLLVMSWPPTIISRVPNNHLALQLRHWARDQSAVSLLPIVLKPWSEEFVPRGYLIPQHVLFFFLVEIKNENPPSIHRKVQHAGKSFPPKETELRLFRRRFANTLLLFGIRSCTFIVLTCVTPSSSVVSFFYLMHACPVTHKVQLLLCDFYFT